VHDFFKYAIVKLWFITGTANNSYNIKKAVKKYFFFNKSVYILVNKNLKISDIYVHDVVYHMKYGSFSFFNI